MSEGERVRQARSGPGAAHGEGQADVLRWHADCHGQDRYFGNPFPLRDEAEREQVIKHYKAYFWESTNTDPDFRRRVTELNDQRLGCFRAPKTCHGDVIKAWLDAGGPLKDG